MIGYLYYGTSLTNNQKIVLEALEDSEQPLGAYSILFNIEKKGIKSPQQVYRALDKLIEIGAVHKIESLNSYIACKHKDCKARVYIIFNLSGVPKSL